jgi:hypothetical protein
MLLLLFGNKSEVNKDLIESGVYESGLFVYMPAFTLVTVNPMANPSLHSRAGLESGATIEFSSLR